MNQDYRYRSGRQGSNQGYSRGSSRQGYNYYGSWQGSGQDYHSMMHLSEVGMTYNQTGSDTNGMFWTRWVNLIAGILLFIAP
jgi:hypothetical protein